MRPFTRLQRGSTNWPFVIVLLALLVFIYMWWDSQDGRDQDIERIQVLEAKNSALLTKANLDRERETALAQVVGFPQTVEPDDNLGLVAGVTVDTNMLRQHLEPEGMVVSGETSMDGTMNHLLKTAQLRYEQKRRIGEYDAQAVDYAWKNASDELKSALDEINEMEHPVEPRKPADPDDADAMADYNEKMEQYLKDLDEWHAKLKEAVEAKGFDEWAQTVTRYELSGQDEKQIVQVLFAAKPSGITVQDFFAAVRDIPSKMSSEMSSVVTAYVDQFEDQAQRLAVLQTQLKEKEDELAQQRQQYSDDMAENAGKIQTLQEEISAAQLESQTMRNELAKAREDFLSQRARLVADKQALEEGFRLVKQERELTVRRDDKDGEIIAANNRLNSGTINLGFSDKVYVGQRFTVSALDRVGDRVDKGVVMITKVTGRHSARVRIVDKWDTITTGDQLHNPLYNATDPIHVYFAGPLAKWPKDMARGRLASMGVILQDSIDGDTDYVVVPNSWTVTDDDEGGEDDDEEEEEMSGAKTPLEKMEDRARIVGATVVTERLFDAFLAY